MPSKFPPTREADLVGFTQNFATKITATPLVYSLTAPQATTYSGLSVSFVDAFNLCVSKDTRTPKNITLKDAAKESLLVNLRMLARIVQNSPSTTNAMRDDLNLPQRGLTPTPVAAPGTPNRFVATLSTDGTLTSSWKCANPKGASGTIYQVYRAIGATGAQVYVGGSGEKKFVDSTIPAGSTQVTYSIQAVRSTASGPWAQFTVKFGVNGVTSADEEVAPLRRAA